MTRFRALISMTISNIEYEYEYEEEDEEEYEFSPLPFRSASPTASLT